MFILQATITGRLRLSAVILKTLMPIRIEWEVFVCPDVVQYATGKPINRWHSLPRHTNVNPVNSLMLALIYFLDIVLYETLSFCINPLMLLRGVILILCPVKLEFIAGIPMCVYHVMMIFVRLWTRTYANADMFSSGKAMLIFWMLIFISDIEDVARTSLTPFCGNFVWHGG